MRTELKEPVAYRVVARALPILRVEGIAIAVQEDLGGGRPGGVEGGGRRVSGVAVGGQAIMGVLTVHVGRGRRYVSGRGQASMADAMGETSVCWSTAHYYISG